MKKLLVATALIAIPAGAAAPIAYMIDLSSHAVLYAKDADRRMPPASMAKMMTVYVVFDMIKKGELRLDKQFTVRPETWQKWHGPAAGSTMFLSAGESVSVENLLHGVVTLSGNDACVVLAEGISGTEPAFVARMNQAARKLGLTNSQFGTSNGWPDNGVTYVTAKDLAHLAEATIEEHPGLYKQFYSQTSFTWGKTLGAGADITQANRDPLLGRVEGADGLKTGHTDEAGYGFTGSAQQGNRRLVMVVAGLGSFNDRISQSVSFMNWGFHAWTAKPLFAKGKQVGEARVELGNAATVPLVAPRDLALTIPAGSDAGMTMKIVYTGPLHPPIKAGDHVADLVVTSADAGVQTLPLAAAKDVDEAGFFGRLWAGLKALLGLA